MLSSFAEFTIKTIRSDMKKLTSIILLLVIAAGIIRAQEPRKSSFDDYVFKTPVAYKTSYSNDVQRIVDIYDVGQYTCLDFTDEMKTLRDSADVYIHPYDYLYDPVNKKRYHLVNSVGIPKFERTMYLKGKAGQTVKHQLKYTLCFNRIPSDVKYVEYHHAPDWESPEKCYYGITFYDIDLTKRKAYDSSDIMWMSVAPEAEKVRFFTPLTVLKKHGSEEGKCNVYISMAYRNVDNESKYSSITLQLDNDLYLYDHATGKSYPSANIYGYPEGRQTWITGWDILAFGYVFGDVDPDVEVVDVMTGKTCLIKGLRLK